MLNTFENILYRDGRVFIDIATSGCGSSCTYCYVKDAHQKQVLIDEVNFNQSLLSILENPKYIQGKYGSIISLCPNTEPFKSKDSAKLIISVLKFFLPLGNPIQISTKELVDIDVVRFAQTNSLYEKQVFFNISSSCISKAHLVEPFASPIEIRFNSFDIIKNFSKLTSCLYIKPFNDNTFSDLDKYVNLINKYKPDTICVGIDFKKNSILDKPCDLLYHDEDIICKALDSSIMDKLTQFRSKLFNETVNNHIFHSSICVISNVIDTTPKLDIWKIAPNLCTQCRKCNDNIKDIS